MPANIHVDTVRHYEQQALEACRIGATNKTLSFNEALKALKRQCGLCPDVACGCTVGVSSGPNLASSQLGAADLHRQSDLASVCPKTFLLFLKRASIASCEPVLGC